MTLDLFALKIESLSDVDLLPTPDILAGEIVDKLETALDLLT